LAVTGGISGTVGDGGLPTSLFRLPRKGKTGMNHVRRRLSYFSVIDSETGHPAHFVGDSSTPNLVLMYV